MKKKKGKQGMMVLKIYLEKAYDRVEKDFLEDILHKVGFNDHFMQRFYEVYAQASLSILWNGV